MLLSGLKLPRDSSLPTVTSETLSQANKALHEPFLAYLSSILFHPVVLTCHTPAMRDDLWC